MNHVIKYCRDIKRVCVCFCLFLYGFSTVSQRQISVSIFFISSTLGVWVLCNMPEDTSSDIKLLIVCVRGLWLF